MKRLVGLLTPENVTELMMVIRRCRSGGLCEERRVRVTRLRWPPPEGGTPKEVPSIFDGSSTNCAHRHQGRTGNGVEF